MSQRTVPAPFLTKTYELVDDPSTDDVVSWNETGTTFVVWKTADFSRDLLPLYFKHNNFSSFVRQLNTYGFRKTVPCKWEFANDNFKRGQKELLAQMRRKVVATSLPAQRPTDTATAVNPSSPVNSGGDGLGSTSASSPNSKNLGSVDTPSATQLANLSDENEKLKSDNQTLSSKLVHTKKQCDELIAFLTNYVKARPDQINCIMSQGFSGSSNDEVVRKLSLNINVDEEMFEDGDDNDEVVRKVSLNVSYNDEKVENGDDDDEVVRKLSLNINVDDEKFENDDDDDDINMDRRSLKLFGVLLEGKKKKRGRNE